MNFVRRKIVGLVVIMIINPIHIIAVTKNTRASIRRAPVRKRQASNPQALGKNLPVYPMHGMNKEFGNLFNQSHIFNATTGKFPTQNNRIEIIADQNQQLQEKIVVHAKATYPLLHQNVHLFLDRFLQYKRQNGTNKEKSLYAAMNGQQFLMRLLEQRPLMFMTEADQYLLRFNGISGYGGFETIGTASERSPLVLKDYLSYEEMAVAALIGISSPTYFINNGARDNRAIAGIEGSYEKEGIYTGLVGARFEKPGYMEWEHIIITPKQNTQENGYGLNASNKGILSLWSNLYGEKFPTFAEAKSDRSGKYVLLNNGFYFNTSVYKKRMRLVVEPFLVDAHNRALLQNKRHMFIQLVWD